MADLEDIMTCVKTARERRLVAGALGIYGYEAVDFVIFVLCLRLICHVSGSYGGYMTTRCLSLYGPMFAVGVSMYGFLSLRHMSMEGGDLTWEEEVTTLCVEAVHCFRMTRKFGQYVGPIAWPLTPDATRHDVDAAKVSTPTLFMHGAGSDDDDACLISF